MCRRVEDTKLNQMFISSEVFLSFPVIVLLLGQNIFFCILFDYQTASPFISSGLAA